MKENIQTGLLIFAVILLMFIAFRVSGLPFMETTSPVVVNTQTYPQNYPNNNPVINTPGNTQQNNYQSLVFNKLVAQYKNGMVSECPSNGVMFYTASLNGYDTTTDIYGFDGSKIGSMGGINGNQRQGQTNIDMSHCTRAYVVDHNVWGFPAINIHSIVY